MYIYLMLLASTLSSPRLDVEIGGKDCYIKTIVYDGWNSYVHMIGNCDYIYKKCIEDNCDVDEIPQKELNFGKKDIG
jgi:hypothetical protein